jgi:hypothetical protein
VAGRAKGLELVDLMKNAHGTWRHRANQETGTGLSTGTAIADVGNYLSRSKFRKCFAQSKVHYLQGPRLLLLQKLGAHMLL